jgi:hypothetical protein
MEKQDLVFLVSEEDVIDGSVKMVVSPRLNKGEVWVLDAVLMDWPSRLPRSLEDENVMNIAAPRAIKLYPFDGKEKEAENAENEKVGTNENQRSGSRNEVRGHESQSPRMPDPENQGTQGCECGL